MAVAVLETAAYDVVAQAEAILAEQPTFESVSYPTDTVYPSVLRGTVYYAGVGDTLRAERENGIHIYPSARTDVQAAPAADVDNPFSGSDAILAGWKTDGAHQDWDTRSTAMVRGWTIDDAERVGERTHEARTFVGGLPEGVEYQPFVGNATEYQAEHAPQRVTRRTRTSEEIMADWGFDLAQAVNENHDVYYWRTVEDTAQQMLVESPGSNADVIVAEARRVVDATMPGLMDSKGFRFEAASDEKRISFGVGKLFRKMSERTQQAINRPVAALHLLAIEARERLQGMTTKRKLAVGAAGALALGAGLAGLMASEANLMDSAVPFEEIANGLIPATDK